MTPTELTEIGARLFTRPGASSSHGWQTRLARHFSVDGRTVRRWVAGDAPVPAGIERELRAMVAITPPPAGTTDADDRDDAMRDAIAPTLARIAADYSAAGWHEGEIVTAMLAYAVERMRAAVGDAPTRQTLAAVIRMLDD